MKFSVAGWRLRPGGLAPCVNKKSSKACLKQALHRLHVSFCFLSEELFVIQPTPLGFSVKVLCHSSSLFFSVPDGRGWTEGCCFEGRRVQSVRDFRWVCIFLLSARLTQQWGKSMEMVLKWCFPGLKKSVLAISIMNINVSNQAHLYFLSISDPQRREIPFWAFQAHCHWSDTAWWTLIGRSERGLSHHSRTYI